MNLSVGVSISVLRIWTLEEVVNRFRRDFLGRQLYGQGIHENWKRSDYNLDLGLIRITGSVDGVNRLHCPRQMLLYVESGEPIYRTFTGSETSASNLLNEKRGEILLTKFTTGNINFSVDTRAAC